MEPLDQCDELGAEDPPTSPEEVVLTRTELYEKVWTEPVMVLAKGYGLSDRGLGKLCARYNIPVPPRGYWARKRVGQRVKRPALPANGSPSGQIRFMKHASSAKSEPAPEPPAIAFERQPENEIVVSDHVRLKHPLVAKTRELLQGAHCDQRGIYFAVADALSVRVSAVSRTRALRILEVLIRELDARGHAVSVRSKKQEQYGYYAQNVRTSTTIAMVLGEEIEIGIEERATQVAKGKGVDLRGKQVRRTHSMPYDYVPSGRLSFEIRTWSPMGRLRWTDGKRKLEERLNDIIIGLLRTALALKDARAQAERRREQERLAEERRKEEERVRAAESARVRRARTHARALQENRQIRRLLREFAREAAKRNQIVEADSEVGQWLLWLTEYAERTDPVRQLLEGASVETVAADDETTKASNDKPMCQPGWRLAFATG